MVIFALILFFASIDSSYYESIAHDSESREKNAVLQAKSYTVFKDALLHADSDTLIIFDVDEVLCTTDDIFLKPELEVAFLSHVKKAMMEAKDQAAREEIEKKLSIGLTEAKRHAVEAEMAAFIAKLQKGEKKVIALTSHPTGKFGYLEDVARWKVESVKSMGFHFEQSFPDYKNRSYTTLSREDMPSPIYLDGILFSRGFSKGDVLLAFLETCPKMPKKVIFIDDLMKNHESLLTALSSRGIGFEGYHYTKAHLAKEEIDEELVRYQFNYLMSHGKWIADCEAKTERELFLTASSTLEES